MGQAIEGARAMLPLVEQRHADQLGPVRDTLSQLQMAYSQLAQGGAAAEPAGDEGGGGEPPDAARARGPGPGAVVGPPLGPRAVAPGRRPRCRLSRVRAAASRLPLRAFPGLRRAAAVSRPPNTRNPEGLPCKIFLIDNGVVIALVCASLRRRLRRSHQPRRCSRCRPGNETMQRPLAAIQEGASAYLHRQYTTIAIVGVVLFVALIFLQDIEVAIGFLIGGVAVRRGRLHRHERLRALQRPRRRGGARRHRPGADVAFRGGAVTGMLVVGLALLGVAGYYGILTSFFDVEPKEAVDALVGLGFGGSLISVFARLGGGIFTKGADVGADIVGKIEAGIPEDDPRNPAVIADNVGDNVGDCAGMAADLFETYAVTAVAVMLLGVLTFDDAQATAGRRSTRWCSAASRSSRRSSARSPSSPPAATSSARSTRACRSPASSPRSRSTRSPSG